MDDQLIKERFPQRRSLRLPDYDYSWQGAYFVTICTKDRLCLFGHIIDSTMKLRHSGEAVESVWKDLPLHYPELNNDVFTVMPNHIHGIVAINEIRRAGSKPAPTKHYPLSKIVRGFKTYSSREINQIRNCPGTSV